jgi:predicted nucleic acid-binding protein
VNAGVVSYLLDTGWIVRHMRGHQAYTESIARLAPDGLAVSIISVAELQEGVSLAKDREPAYCDLGLSSARVADNANTFRSAIGSTIQSTRARPQP